VLVLMTFSDCGLMMTESAEGWAAAETTHAASTKERIAFLKGIRIFTKVIGILNICYM